MQTVTAPIITDAPSSNVQAKADALYLAGQPVRYEGYTTTDDGLIAWRGQVLNSEGTGWYHCGYLHDGARVHGTWCSCTAGSHGVGCKHALLFVRRHEETRRARANGRINRGDRLGSLDAGPMRSLLPASLVDDCQLEGLAPGAYPEDQSLWWEAF
jgi:hypothetical protein